MAYVAIAALLLSFYFYSTFSTTLKNVTILLVTLFYFFTGYSLEGILSSNGMAAFNDVVTKEDTRLIHNYVRGRAEQDRLVAVGEIEAGQERLTWQDLED